MSPDAKIIEEQTSLGKCLVVGSAHVDVFADIKGLVDVIDRRGDLHVGIGGTAFNVAANFTSLGLRPILISVLKERALFTRLILSKMDDMDLCREGIILSNDIGEAGFIAHRHRGELLHAVSSTPIEDVAINARDFEAVAQEAAFIVCDLNNSLSTIKAFLTFRKPLYLMGVSEPKVLKLLTLKNELKPGDTVAAVFLNRAEAGVLLRKPAGAHGRYEDLSSIIDTVWVITKDAEGVVVVQNGEITLELPALHIDKVSSFSGAGDAFAAGFIHAIHVAGLGLHAAATRALNFTKATIEQTHANAITDNLMSNVDSVIFQDSMTLLYNKRFYDEEKGNVERTLRRRADDGVAVAMIDIDDFKKVNDTHGHDMGDVCIKTLARVIRNNVRGQDIAIRFGGEEFLIIFRNSRIAAAFEIAERIRSKFEREIIRHNGISLSKTISGGVAALSDPSSKLDDLVKSADEALYKAKESGKNVILCASKSHYFRVGA